jgi:hypothetical protein
MQFNLSITTGRANVSHQAVIQAPTNVVDAPAGEELKAFSLLLSVQNAQRML